MHISKILSATRPLISFEFFPPKTQSAATELFKTIRDLMPLDPSYVSVTYGAGGSSRQLTRELVLKLQKETNLTVVSHLTCVGAKREEIKEILKLYHDSGIENIMALRGDPPRENKEYFDTEKDFQHASDLVAFIKMHFSDLGIGVAGFPEGHRATPNRLKEIEFLKNKVDCGADYICTQLFFDNRDFYDFCERCQLAGIKVPIIAGIMPITSIKGMNRMAELAPSSRFPAKLIKKMNRTKNDEHAYHVGIEWATEQVRDLVDNKTIGLHFYTLNKSKATLEIYESLGVVSSEALKQMKGSGSNVPGEKEN